MSEPTKEQIAEAIEWLHGYAVQELDGMVMNAVGLAHVIARVRTKSHNDALEEAAATIEAMQVIEENAAAISRYQVEHDETIDACAAAIRTRKQTSDAGVEP